MVYTITCSNPNCRYKGEPTERQQGSAILGILLLLAFLLPGILYFMFKYRTAYYCPQCGMEFKGRPLESGLPNWFYMLIAILGMVGLGWLLLEHSQALSFLFEAVSILLLLIIVSPFLLKVAAKVVRAVKKASG